MLLLVHLQNLGFQATGTMRENRLSKCSSKVSKLMKKEEYSILDLIILIVKWVYNKCVTVRTNYDTVQSIKKVQRWQRNLEHLARLSQMFHMEIVSVAVRGL